MRNRTENITHILFDLGGVIIELRGPAIRTEWIAADLTTDEIWERWLLSPAVRSFETGRISPTDFARQIVDELNLKVSVEGFLDRFRDLMLGLYEGAPELLLALRPNYTTALYSNSNEVHWKIKMGEFGLGEMFDYHFPSHLIGIVKPDRESLEYVLNELGVAAGHVLFMDDNRLNVESARDLGIVAERVKGIEEAKLCLSRHGISW